jgi:putative acetyltransferase
MTITTRTANRNEWPAILAIHRRAIHETAADDYSAEVLAAWGPPIVGSQLERFDAKLQRGQIIIAAEVDGAIAGFGEIAPDKNQLVAVYVSPDYSRQGVGTAILAELERVSVERGLSFLQMGASLTAVPFYKARGFQVLGPDVHLLRSGAKMDCVRMRKTLTHALHKKLNIGFLASHNGSNMQAT